MRGPAYRIETERLVARCYAPTDAPRFRAGLDENDQYLRPWIPWMRDEPQTLEQTTLRMRRTRAAFDSDSDFRYGLFDPSEETFLGEIALLTRAGPGAREVGYWIDRRHAGRGLATEAAAAVVRVAFEIDRVDRLEIHHSAENVASGAVPKRLGFTLDATMRRRAHDADDVVRDMMIWSLYADEYASSPARHFAIRAWDCLGAPIALGDEA